MKKILHFIKKHKIWTAAIVLAVLIIVGFASTRGEKAPKRESVAVAETNVVQEVDVTGRVEAAQKVDLAIQTGGKIQMVAFKVGDTVKAGDTILKVNTDDLDIQLSRERADLSKAEIELAKQQPKTTSSDDLRKAYEDAFNIVSTTFIDLNSTIENLDTILDEDYLSSNTIRIRHNDRAQDFRDQAVKNFFDSRKAYNDSLKIYRTLSRESSNEVIESFVDETYDTTKLISDAVKSTNNLVDYIENRLEPEDRPAAIETDQEDLDTFTENINTSLADLIEIRDKINDAKLGISDEGQDIESLKLDVQQAKLDIQDTLVQIGHRTLRSPINGVVTNIDAEVGETVSANEPIVSVISASEFQIKTDLPEADITKVKVGADADVFLDAYGDDILFKATVVSVDPAETVLDGVATYKTTLQFAEKDDRIKSGMTADIPIKGERRDNVLAIPQRAVISSNDRKYVQVLVGDQVVEKNVTTGLRGSDGDIEILSGLDVGDQVIVFTEEK